MPEPETLTPESFAEILHVSRETLARLQTYVDLLARWNAKINLVGGETLADVWRRHILDSGQLVRHIDRSVRSLVDLGSGAGLPGLVLAILGVPDVHLIEADQRKAAFLREAARVTRTVVTVHAARIEGVKPFPADIVTARALAPLSELLKWSLAFQGENTVCLFLKGQSVRDELTAASARWIMQTQILASLTDPSGHILRVEGLRAAHRRPPTERSRG